MVLGSREAHPYRRLSEKIYFPQISSWTWGGRRWGQKDQSIVGAGQDEIPFVYQECGFTMLLLCYVYI